MKELHIIVDSTANIPPEWLTKYSHLHIVPLYVICGEQVWQDGQLTNSELFQKMEESQFRLRTSQPSPGDFLKVLEPIVATGAQAVVITMTGGLSGTVQSAQIAADMIGHDVFVIDSKTTAWGMAHMAKVGLQLVEQGWSPAGVIERLRALAALTHTIFVPGTLEYLQRGGRIGGAAALFASILQIRPVLQLVNGQVVVLDKIRTRSRAVLRMIDELQVHAPEAIGIVHIEAQAEAQKLREAVAALYSEAEVTVSEGGAVLATHLGPGLIGLIFQERLAQAAIGGKNSDAQ